MVYWMHVNEELLTSLVKKQEPHNFNLDDYKHHWRRDVSEGIKGDLFKLICCVWILSSLARVLHIFIRRTVCPLTRGKYSLSRLFRRVVRLNKFLFQAWNIFLLWRLLQMYYRRLYTGILLMSIQVHGLCTTFLEGVPWNVLSYGTVLLLSIYLLKVHFWLSELLTVR